MKDKIKTVLVNSNQKIELYFTNLEEEEDLDEIVKILQQKYNIIIKNDFCGPGARIVSLKIENTEFILVNDFTGSTLYTKDVTKMLLMEDIKKCIEDAE